MNNKHEEVQEYYGKEIADKSDLKTSACCAIEAPPKYIVEILDQIHEEVQAKFYGCGLTIPSKIQNLRILDLGSGSGRDCFIASKLVGEEGSVVGIDMTDEQLEVANKYRNFHADAFGYKRSNVAFIKGNIDNLESLNLEPNSFDLIISNCVINLCTDKEKVFQNAFNLLKPGGEMYFSDVYSDRRVPAHLQNDSVLWGECLSGALYWNDFLTYANNAGFKDPRAVTSRFLEIENEKVQSKIGDIKFYSVTYRLFKLGKLEKDCEDYGQAVKYLGTIKNHENSWNLDNHHNFPAGKMMSVCGNTLRMLKNTRFQSHFEFYGDFSQHYGIYESCGGAMPFNEDDAAAACC